MKAAYWEIINRENQIIRLIFVAWLCLKDCQQKNTKYRIGVAAEEMCLKYHM